MNKEDLVNELNNLIKSMNQIGKMLQENPDEELYPDIESESKENIQCNGECGECINSLEDDSFDIKSCFESNNDTIEMLRALNLESAVRMKRIELNNGWVPDWSLINVPKYTICASKSVYPRGIDLSATWVDSSYNTAPIFGYYEHVEYVREIIEQFEDELIWYFGEYLPNIDKMCIQKD